MLEQRLRRATTGAFGQRIGERLVGLAAIMSLDELEERGSAGGAGFEKRRPRTATEADVVDASVLQPVHAAAVADLGERKGGVEAPIDLLSGVVDPFDQPRRCPFRVQAGPAPHRLLTKRAVTLCDRSQLGQAAFVQKRGIVVRKRGPGLDLPEADYALAHLLGQFGPARLQGGRDEPNRGGPGRIDAVVAFGMGACPGVVIGLVEVELLHQFRRGVAIA